MVYTEKKAGPYNEDKKSHSWKESGTVHQETFCRALEFEVGNEPPNKVDRCSFGKAMKGIGETNNQCPLFLLSRSEKQ